jgi:hypothetical protein
MVKVLVSDSLQETLWRLEEVRQGFRNGSSAEVQEALGWVLSRQGLEGSYCGLFMPTAKDLKQGAQLPTGEHIQSDAGSRHVLGEEALRTAIVWKLDHSPQVAKALEGFKQILERGSKTGKYCCGMCTTAFLRTLQTAKISEKNRVIEMSIARMKKTRKPDGRWRTFPFYYTLLTLSEMDSPSAREELKHASTTARNLLRRHKGTDRTSLFRSLALKAVLDTIR